MLFLIVSTLCLSECRWNFLWHHLITCLSNLTRLNLYIFMTKFQISWENLFKIEKNELISIEKRKNETGCFWGVKSDFVFPLFRFSTTEAAFYLSPLKLPTARRIIWTRFFRLFSAINNHKLHISFATLC